LHAINADLKLRSVKNTKLIINMVMAIAANIITYNVMSPFINDTKKFMIWNGTTKKLKLMGQGRDTRKTHQRLEYFWHFS
jgi:hypothetical protein